MSNFLYVDNSNLWIEGMRLAALRSGLTSNLKSAHSGSGFDQDFRVDFGRLLEFAGGPDIGRAVLFGSTPPTSDSLWERAKDRGFEVIVHERNLSNREKMVDTRIAVEMIEDSFLRVKPEDTITLVSGDSDHVPIVTKLSARGLRVEVCFWQSASRALREAATRFIVLDPYLEYLNANR